MLTLYGTRPGAFDDVSRSVAARSALAVAVDGADITAGLERAVARRGT